MTKTDTLIIVITSPLAAFRRTLDSSIILGFHIYRENFTGEVVLFLQILLVIRHYQKTSPLSKTQTGLRFGAAFGLIYLFGMQEVVLPTANGRILDWIHRQ